MLNTCFSGEYFLQDYLYKNTNFNQATLKTVYSVEGYHDEYNVGNALLQSNEEKIGVIEARRHGIEVDATDKKYRYEFAMTPQSGFLSNPDVLVRDAELSLRFDRAVPKIAFVGAKADVTGVTLDAVEIEDCYMLADYVMSEKLRRQFESITTTPFVYEYDRCDVITKTISQGETHIRLDGIRGGNTPNYVFAGIIDKEAYDGTLTKSSTGFKAHGVEWMNITLNGVSVNGYPIMVKNEDAIFPLYKFLDTIQKIDDIATGDSFTPVAFDFNYLWSHAFEGELVSSGWLGIEFKVKTPFNRPMYMVIWTVTPSKLTINKFNEINRIQL